MTAHGLYLGTEESTGSLRRHTARYRTALRRAGVRPRRLVALAGEHPLSFLAAYQACLELEAVPGVLRPGHEVLGLAHLMHAEFLWHQVGSGEPEAARLDRERRSPVPAGVTAIVQTSGSTGSPAFVPLTGEGIRYQVRETVGRVTYAEDDRIVVTVPLSGAYGLSLVEIWRALPLTLIIPAQLTGRALWALVGATGATAFEGVPALYTMVARWLRRQRVDRHAVSRVRLWCCGGDVLPVTLAQEWLRLLDRPLLDGYGLSEAGPNVAVNGPHDWRLATVGRPLVGTEVRCEPSGELLVRSPSVMPGYWPLEAQRPSPVTATGWLRTGDLAELTSEGYVCIRGRLKNVLIVNGENVVPEAVEMVLRQHPAVADVAVVGVRDGARGDHVHAFVVPRNEIVDMQELRAFARTSLPSASRPRHYTALDDLPRAPSGKINRQHLRLLAVRVHRTADGVQSGSLHRS